ncbi:MAG TPA: M23 family metallopeptidase, partial [Actinomycetota bacterium]|nr:M23 family metallopeptidase [Actinomycetota bacterium]
MRRVLVGVTILVTLPCVVALACAPPAAADSLAGARARERALRTQLQAAAARLDAANDALEAVEQRLAFDQRQVAQAGSRLAAARASLDGQVASIYRSGGMAMVGAILGNSTNQMPERVELLTVLLDRQSEGVAEADAASESYRFALARLRDDRAQARAAHGGAAAALAQLNGKLKTASALTTRLAGFPGGQSSYPPPVLGGIACPVEPPYTFTDTYGAPRPGGRTHKGTDVMAPYGAREFAYTAGVISDEHANALGGITLYLKGDDGNEYYYAHLSRYAVARGARVVAGQLVGYVGNTGD